ncbi:MAG: HAD-IIB family hydrolase, partial [Turicibacter sp.]
SYMNTKSGIISATELPDNHIYKLLNKTLKPEDQILLEVIPNIDDIFIKYENDILKGVCREEVDTERLLKAKAELKKANPHLEIVSSWHNNFEVMKKGSSKGDAVKALSTFFNLTPAEVMCIGDSENDLSMIKYAGIGVAMGNAIDIIKEQAQYVTAENTKGGVAQAIHKFILDEPSL